MKDRDNLRLRNGPVTFRLHNGPVTFRLRNGPVTFRVPKVSVQWSSHFYGHFRVWLSVCQSVCLAGWLAVCLSFCPPPPLPTAGVPA